MLYRNQVNVGMAHYPSGGEIFEFEIGVKNDSDGCLNLLNALVAPFPHHFSCGLARRVILKDQAEVEAFFRRVGIALAAGSLACKISKNHSD